MLQLRGREGNMQVWNTAEMRGREGEGVTKMAMQGSGRSMCKHRHTRHPELIKGEQVHASDMNEREREGEREDGIKGDYSMAVK